MKAEEYKTCNPEGMQEVSKAIKACGYYMIATAESDQPRVRPFGTCHIFEDKLYIQAAHCKRIAAQIKANNRVELCAFNTENHSWIRLAGRLQEDDRVEAKKSMLDEYTDMRSIYNENDDNIAVYYLTDAVAWITCSYAPEKEIRF